MWRVLRYVLSIQSLQKERQFHENKHDGRHKYDKKLNQGNNNQDEMSYNLRTHMVKNGNPICEHGMDARKENKDTQKYAESYNQEYNKTNTQMEIYFEEQEEACD
jgi:hypothetical protein